MGSMKSKVAYLQGVIEGISLDIKTKEGKVLSEIVKVLGDMADKLDEIEDKQENLEMYIGILDNDLQDVEENFYGYEDSEEYIVEDDFIEYQCPRCGEKIYIDKSIVENKEMINCPNCSFNLIYDGIQGMND